MSIALEFARKFGKKLPPESAGFGIRFFTVMVTLPGPPRNRWGTTRSLRPKDLHKGGGTTFSLRIPRGGARKCDHYGKSCTRTSEFSTFLDRKTKYTPPYFLKNDFEGGV